MRIAIEKTDEQASPVMQAFFEVNDAAFQTEAAKWFYKLIQSVELELEPNNAAQWIHHKHVAK